MTHTCQCIRLSRLGVTVELQYLDVLLAEPNTD
jgi:hypothetical protein